MHTAALALMLAIAPAEASEVEVKNNLLFHGGSLDGWESKGFYLTTADTRGPGLSWAVSSSDGGNPDRTGMLHRPFKVPPGSGILRCTAYASYGKGKKSVNDLDLVLFGPGKKIIQKQVLLGKEWKNVEGVFARDKDGKAREYRWHLAGHGGQTLRLALIDEDKRPDCYLYAASFSFTPLDVYESREFGQFMLKLTNDQKLSPVARFDSQHFIAMSNASDEFTERRLLNCELMYHEYFQHFRDKKGFAIQEPPTKLMVALFDTQAGFHAYGGQPLSPFVMGYYDPRSNRLVVYDIGTNEILVAAKRQAGRISRSIPSDMDRQRYIATVDRRLQESRTESNVGTIMHEVMHQLNFNTGLLNRNGDWPRWLVEGMGTYAEATVNHSWQGLGGPNYERAGTLARGGPLIPLADLVSNDDWLMGSGANVQTIMMGYAQGWALFKMLMEERTEQLKQYLRVVYSRKTGDRRQMDFAAAFGGDLKRLELRHLEYCREMVEKYGKPGRK